MNWIGYDKSTGQILSRGVSRNMPHDSDTMLYMEHLHKGETHVVDGKPTKVLDPELEWAKVRKRRNKALADTDWTQLSDIDPDLATEMAKFRQTLRDLPQICEDPFKVVWPAHPLGPDEKLKDHVDALKQAKI